MGTEATPGSLVPSEGFRGAWGDMVGATAMVEFVKLSKDGYLLKIIEVSDKYRDQPYTGEEDAQ
ncbi:MAG: hypothetical protein JXA00_04830 [Candidatus Thermoplasmatota archaeon]|nr:hypothetical protein [Candidatus Thermoplasmatota archaeon]